jgi:DNA-directed RNA polymerase specialized sigma subunit
MPTTAPDSQQSSNLAPTTATSRERAVEACASMRRILAERAADRLTSMHDGATLLDGIPTTDTNDLEVALTELYELDPRLCRLAELRFLCGLTTDQIATVLETSPSQTKRDWDTALSQLVKSLRNRHSTTADRTVAG